MEVSTAGLHQPAGEMYPHPEFLRMFREAGVPITLASDAHYPTDCARDRDRALEFARAAVPVNGDERQPPELPRELQVPPELREARGEFEVAAAGELPELIELGDIRGDMHMHTTETDGLNSLEEMVAAARDAQEGRTRWGPLSEDP